MYLVLIKNKDNFSDGDNHFYRPFVYADPLDVIRQQKRNPDAIVYALNSLQQIDHIEVTTNDVNVTT